MNQIQIIGKLGKDVQVKYTSTGKAVAEVSVAADSWHGKEKKTEWFNLQAWEKTAEILQRAGKGDLIFCDGRMTTTKYQDRNGVEKWMTRLIASRVFIIDAARTFGNMQQSTNAPMPKKSVVEESQASLFSEDDVPF